MRTGKFSIDDHAIPLRYAEKMTDSDRLTRYIFVGGAPRSGTTLLQNMLDSHPEIIGGPEFLHLPDIIRLRQSMQPNLSKGWLDEYCTSNEADAYIKQLIDNFLLPIARNKEVSFISEKTPANISVFSDLAVMYPDAFFIHILRDPRAVVASMLKVGRRARKKGIQTQSFTRNTIHAANFLKKCYAEGAAFQSGNDSRLLTIKYEDLVKNPEALTHRICTFLELSWDSRMLRPDKYEHSGEEAITNDIWYSKEEYKRRPTGAAIDKWKNDLSFAQRSLLYYFFRSNQTLRSHGYQLESEFSSSIVSDLTCIIGRIIFVSLKLKMKIQNQLKRLRTIISQN
jgi:hypothetical protein